MAETCSLVGSRPNTKQKDIIPVDNLPERTDAGFQTIESRSREERIAFISFSGLGSLGPVLLVVEV